MTVLEIPLVDLAQFQASGGTTVGGATAVASDDGDASYIEVVWGTTFDIGGTLYADSTSDAWSGVLAPAPIPPGATIDGADIRVTYRSPGWSSSDSSHRLFITTDPAALSTYPGTQPDTVYAEGIADPTKATAVNLGPSLSTPWQVTATSLPGNFDAGTLRAGGLPIWLYEEGNSSGPDAIRITEVVVLVAYTATTTAPPLRQYPRSDGLGTSSARRMWPPSRSYQRSNRRAGGYL